MKLLLKPKGFITVEFPHLMRLMEESQFDTIYHEHFSYYSFMTANSLISIKFIPFDVKKMSSDEVIIVEKNLFGLIGKQMMMGRFKADID